MNLQELLKQYIVVIPSIQREYAFGRIDKETEEKRKKFLDYLWEAVKNKNKPLHLDFVYGKTSKENNTQILEPLDGQQRLTTLFLLYWTFNEEDDINFNNFSYKTRYSAERFCKYLAQKKATDKNNLLDKFIKDKSYQSFGEYLKEQSDFMWSWRYDPTIQSMLQVLSDIVFRKCWNGTIHIQSDITFDFLPLDEINVKDDIYVKMNARGKQLSAFDLKKSHYEEIIQKENLSIINDWRIKVDGTWLDYFGKKFIKKFISKHHNIPNYDDIKEIEKNYLNFWNNMETLYKNLYNNIKESQIIEELFNDTNAIIEEDTSTDISSYLTEKNPPYYFQDKTLFEKMYEAKTPFDLQAMFYCMTIYVRYFKNELKQKNNNVIENFKKFMRVVHNVCLNDNRSDRIDSQAKLQKICSTFDSIFLQYPKQHSNCTDFNDFLAQSFNIDNIQGIDTNTKIYLKEEIEKAKLRLNKTNENDWETLIGVAETDKYLTGQLRCLLDWSGAVKGKKRIDFEIYKIYLSKIFPENDNAKNDKNYLLYSALLSIQDYVNKGIHTLYSFDQNRDYSWKRALRDNKADVLKTFIDEWFSEEQKKYFGTSFTNKMTTIIDIKDFCKQKIDTQNIVDWRKWIIRRPDILQKAANKIIDKTNFLIRHQKIARSYHWDIFLLALKYSICGKTNIGNLNLSQAPDHTLTFTLNGNSYSIKRECKDTYTIKFNDAVQRNTYNTETFSDEEVWNYIKNTINIEYYV